jgi:hypothetical protein
VDKIYQLMDWLVSSQLVKKLLQCSSCGMLSSNFTTPTVSFAAALQGTPEQNKRNNLRHEEIPGKNKHKGMKKEQHEKDQSVGAPRCSK